MDGKVAVLGYEDFVMPFSALGLETFVVEDDKSIEDNAKKILDGNYVLIVAQEQIAEKADNIFADIHKETVPCVVPLPFTGGSTGFATKTLGETLKMATGIDIMQNTQ